MHSMVLIYIKNTNKQAELMLIYYITNYHFEQINGKDYNINNKRVINLIYNVRNIIGDTEQIKNKS